MSLTCFITAWVRSMVQQRDDVVLIDAAILSPPQVWQASGHLTNFSDPLVDCTECKQRFRLDKLDDPDVCPNCDAKHSFTEAREFNLMFKTQAGPVEGTGADAYLRPETAQGMFTNFGQVLQTSRKKPPFGIAQVGKSFRNEITPQNWIFRTREFEQMELELKRTAKKSVISIRMVIGLNSAPTGFCIQPLAIRIHMADRFEPIAIRKVTARCWRLVRRSQPKKNRPIKVDSKKNAISPSMARGAPNTSPT